MIENIGGLIIEGGVLREYAGNGGDVVIPDGVKKIGEDAFLGCGSITSVTIPFGVEAIGTGAFLECTALSSVTLPIGLKTIGDDAFLGCESITSVTIPFGVETIGTGAFLECTALSSVTLPIGLKTIGSMAFFGCKNLLCIDIPEGVEIIGDRAFGDTSLPSLIYPCSVKDCSYRAYHKYQDTVRRRDFKIRFGKLVRYIDSNSRVTVPSGVTKIGRRAFAPSKEFLHLSDPSAVFLPDGLKTIGEAAFLSCRDLISVRIPDSLTEIGKNAFRGCINLRSVHIPEGVQRIGASAFSNCEQLHSVTLPSGVTEIEENTFWSCRSLTSVTLPEGLQKIGKHAFSGCKSLTSVIIPDSVKTIGDQAFSLNDSLTVICSENSAAHRYCTEHYIPFLFDYQYESFHGVLPPELKILRSPFPADEEKPFVFISYSHRDRERVLPVLKTLYESGWKIWYDEGLTVGDSYDETLEKHAAECSAFLLFVTRNSLVSRYIEEREVPWAKSYGKPIVRCILDEGTEYEIPGGRIVGTVPPEGIGQVLGTISGLTKGEARVAKGIVVPVDPSAREVETARGSRAASNQEEEEGFAYCLYAEASASDARTVIHDLTEGGAILYEAGISGKNEEKLMKSACLIVFLDPAFLSDRYLTETLTEAFRSGRDIAVCLLDDVTLPAALEKLDDQQWLNYRYGVRNDLNKKLLLHLEQKGCRNVFVIPGFEYEKTERGIVITGYTSRDPHPVLEREYGGVPVTGIGPHAFVGRNHVTEFVIPEGVTEIGEGAFSDCQSLTSVVIPVGVTKIKDSAFSECTSLASVVIPAGVTIIESDAFNNCQSLTSVTIPASVKEIRSWAFSECTNLHSAVLSDGVQQIGSCAFDDCPKLASVTLPGSVIRIEKDAFSDCPALTVTCPPRSYAERYCKKNGIPYRTDPAL